MRYNLLTSTNKIYSYTHELRSRIKNTLRHVLSSLYISFNDWQEKIVTKLDLSF
jgi:hypothetical protein